MIRKPTKGDWIYLVKKDLLDLNISESFDEIAKLTKNSFKKKVKEACKIFSLKTLKSQIKKKGRELQYKTLETQEYFKSEKLNTAQAKLTFLARTEMLDVKENFRNMKRDQMG